MKSPEQVWQDRKGQLKREWRLAFAAAFFCGLLIHLPILLSDIPNHDGLASMYFDQNMITSGRWFLTVACGFSSYFTIPWVIGLLGLLFLALSAVALVELLEVHDGFVISAISGLLVAFPALASTFAYVFTLDGYMMALLLAVLSVLLTKKYRLGFLGGAVCLAFSMGIYQAYLPFAILLCIYSIVVFIIDDKYMGSTSVQTEERAVSRIKRVLGNALHYLYMGGLGMALYFVILQVLLRIQGKELASYQGINNLEGGGVNSQAGLLTTIGSMYRDFFAFTFKGNVLMNNVFAMTALGLLCILFLFVLFRLCLQRKWWKSPLFFVIIALLAVGLPLATNVIRMISPELNYHLLMRYQWVLYPIVLLAFVERYRDVAGKDAWLQWGTLAAAFVLLFNYAVSDNIAYANLQKKYEKTYAYCLRLLDRIEQTEGYYQGIPIAIIGVVGEEQYPVTDITQKVTAGMIGMNGDSLLYTGANYQEFMKHYLGATLNFLEPDAMKDIYYSKEYIEMETFPGKTATRVVDGVLYVKTENTNRDAK
ncbi:MAG: glucosyltransferase domain-containing protein [Lachnospiraceae bacterium]|nr:glucosyltransferase domain-containing protein [Lachnospiraceae bacterium]